MDTSPPAIVTITLNPAIDRAIRVQNLRPGGHVTGRTVSRVAGGKGVNVSRVLAAMGLGSTAMGLLGRDNASAFTDVFAGGAVRDGFLRVAGSTRDNVTVIDDATGQDTHIRDAGLAPGPAAVQELIEQIGATVEAGDVVIVSGSLPPGMDADALADVLAPAIEAEANVAVDTSGEALEALTKVRCWLIKPNVAELQQLVGRDLPELPAQLKASRGLAQKHDHVLLSRGADGAVLVTRDGAISARCEVAEVVNTVGCGDTLLAVFVATALTGGDATDALAHAVAAAAANAATDKTAAFEPETMQELLTTVDIEELQ